MAACVASTAPGALGGKPKPKAATLAQTPLVGGVTDTSADIVVRTTAKSASVVVRYGTGLLDSATAPVDTVAGDDNGAHIALEGLLPR